MKKFLLCMIAATVLFGCGKCDPAKEDRFVRIDNALKSYNDKCGDIAFADTRNIMDRVHDLNKNEYNLADNLYNSATSSYDRGVANYGRLKNTQEAARRTIQEQNTRLERLENEGERIAPREYAIVKRDVRKYHGYADDLLDDCKPQEAQRYIADAEESLRDLERVMGLRANENTRPVVVVPVPAPSSTSDYIVKRGDTLSDIAESHYGHASYWPLILWDNRNKISNPHWIYPGQRLVIERNPSAAEIERATTHARNYRER